MIFRIKKQQTSGCGFGNCNTHCSVFAFRETLWLTPLLDRICSEVFIALGMVLLLDGNNVDNQWGRPNSVA